MNTTLLSRLSARSATPSSPIEAEHGAAEHGAALAVLGWTAESAEALAALERTRAYRAVAVCDASGAALVQARRMTSVGCYQQARQWLASGDYDALLIGSPQSGGIAALAASRGADLLLLPGACDADTLEGASEAARRSGVRLVLLRPETHDAGLADLRRLLGSPGWEPRSLDITIEGRAEAERLVGTAVAHAVALAPRLHGLVRASAWSGGAGAPLRSVTAVIDDDDRQVRLHARHAPATFLRITADTLGGSVTLQLAEGSSMLSYVTAAGEQVEYAPTWVDHWAAEGARAAEDDDTDRAGEEGALLGAIARSALTGEVQSNDCCARPELRVIEGNGQSRPRRANLRLVVS